jgi:folate-binding protein YgfZ
MTPLPLAPETIEQYMALTDRAGFVDVRDRSQIRITGADRVKFLHGFCTNDIKRLVRGTGCEAFLTNAKGKLVGHVFVFCGSEDLILETSPGQTETIIRHLDRYVIREDVQFHDLQSRAAEFFVAGPHAVEALAGLVGVAVPDVLLAHQTGDVSDVPISVRRVPLAVVPAFLLTCPGHRSDELCGRLIAGGVRRCGAEVFDIARMEAGFPLFGRDINEDCLPQEVNRDAVAISFTKGCYLGQETVARIDALGHVNRKLVGLRWSDLDTLPSDTELTVAGQPIGRVTSAVWSPRQRAVLALAQVRGGFAQGGSRLETSWGVAEVIDWFSARVDIASSGASG